MVACTRSGQRRVALVAGEPGIGKTRLVTEFCRAAHAEGATVLLGRCYEDAPVPYQPFVEALRQYLAAGGEAAPSRRTGRRSAKLLPELGELPDDGRQRDPEVERYRLFDAVASLLSAAAGRSGLILALDDLHWADAPTLLLLGTWCARRSTLPLLVVGTYRETEVEQGASPRGGACRAPSRARRRARTHRRPRRGRSRSADL